MTDVCRNGRKGRRFDEVVYLTKIYCVNGGNQCRCLLYILNSRYTLRRVMGSLQLCHKPHIVCVRDG